MREGPAAELGGAAETADDDGGEGVRAAGGEGGFDGGFVGGVAGNDEEVGLEGGGGDALLFELGLELGGGADEGDACVAGAQGVGEAGVGAATCCAEEGDCWVDGVGGHIVGVQVT